MARIVAGPEITGQVFSSQTGAVMAGVTVTVSPKVYTDPEMSSSTTSLTTNGRGEWSCYARPGIYTFTCSAAGAGPIEPVEVLGQEEGTGTAFSATYALVASKPAIPASRLAPANTLKWRRALSKVRNGTADAKVLCVGDSTTWGYGATSAVGDNWPVQAARMMNSAGVPSALGFIGAPDHLSNNVNKDSRWTPAANWGLASHGFGNDQCWQSTTAGGTLVLNVPTHLGACDTFDVYYLGNGASPAFTVTPTGGSPQTVTPGALNGVGKATVTGTATIGAQVTIDPSTGVVFILGVEPYSSTTRRVRMANAGVPATSTVGWVNNSDNYGPLKAIDAYAPDLTIISLGLNDAPTPTSDAAFTANLTTLVTHARTSGDVMFMTFPPPFSDSGDTARAGYTADYYALADSLGVPVIDVNARFVSYAAANPLGYYFDTLHPTTLGYGDIAQAVTATLLDGLDVSANVSAFKNDPLGWGFPCTMDPLSAQNATSPGASGRINYYRVIGSGTISKIGLEVVTQSGNVCVAAYRGTGTGRSAAPAFQLATSGSVACPASGYAEISLGSSVTLQPGDWLAIAVDNGTATFRGDYSSGIVNNLWAGRSCYQTSGGFPAPATPSGLTVAMNRGVCLIGVP